MRHVVSDIRQGSEIRNAHAKNKDTHTEDFVLEKNIFNNIFEKDIRRVFIYKKAERLAKAIHLIAPAFAESVSLRNRMDTIAIGLVDAAIQPSTTARTALSHELLTLSSILSMARTGGILSPMNAEIISHEAHVLLQEVAAYEEPRLLLDEVLTLSEIAKSASKRKSVQNSDVDSVSVPKRTARDADTDKGHIKDTAEQGSHIKDRREAIMSVIKNKGSASIKDISTLIRDVSEKTIQRELSSLVDGGLIVKRGERRWSTYSLT
ncbi:MAG: DeoR family transcriptional regulator [bacterium]|nr:DeoR family transcriptional regulator [bacterium]